MTTEVSDGASGRSFRRIALWLMAGGLIVRLLFFVGHSQTPMFGVPVLDETYYDSMARELAAEAQPDDAGTSTATAAASAAVSAGASERGFRPLLYPTLMSVVYGLAGETWGFAATLGMHHLLGLLTALMIAILAWRLFDRPAAGAWAGALYLLAAPPLYFEGQLLIVTFFTFLGALLLLWLSTCEVQATWWRWALAGALVGVMAQARANALILILAFPLAAWLLPAGHRASSRADDADAAIAGFPKRVGATLAAWAGVAVILVLVGFWQRDALGGFQLLPSAGGVNFYLGNKQGADGMIPRQDVQTSYGDRYRDSVQVFAEQTYLEESGADTLDARAVSRFWLRKSVDEIRQAPLEWLSLMARKSVLLVWNEEIPNNKSLAFAVEEEPILGWLPVRFWLLLALAGIGLMATFGQETPSAQHARQEISLQQRTLQQRSLRLWLLLYLGLLACAVVLFFINSRFRLPLWPALAVFAGGGALELTRLRRQPSRLAAALGVGAALAVLSLVNWLNVPAFNLHRDYFHRSLALWTKGAVEAARADAEHSVDLEPRDAVSRFHLATVALAQDDLDTAEQQARDAGRIAPKEPRIHNLLGAVLQKKGQNVDAYRAYLHAAELGPDLSAPRINAALLELRAGALKRARQHIIYAEGLGDRSVPLQCARGFLETLSGNPRLGQALIDGAGSRDFEMTRRLVQDQRTPIDLGHVVVRRAEPNDSTP